MSWRPALTRGEKTIHLQLAELLEQDIVGGILLPGTKLPPQRELADYLDINVSTVQKALKVCSLKGLISSHMGRGTYISYDALANTCLLPAGNPEHLIEMGATMPDHSANHIPAALLQQMLGEPDAEKWFCYHHPDDTDWQKDAAVRLLQRCGVAVGKETILSASGGQNALNAILSGVFRPGDRIGADPHVYPGIKTAAAMHGLKLIPVRQKDGSMDAEALLSACLNEELRGIYLIPTHQNPTTRTMPVSARQAVAKAAQKRDLLIIEDGTYQLMEGQLPPVAHFAPERTFYIASLSKTVAPGLRLAYLSAPEPYCAAVSDMLYNLNVSVSPLMAELAARIMVSGALEEILALHLAGTRRRNALVNKTLSRYRCLGGDTCIFRWLLLPGRLSGAFFEDAARKAGVRVYAAERFTVGATVPERAVRLAVCAPDTEEELERALSILLRLLSELEH